MCACVHVCVCLWSMYVCTSFKQYLHTVGVPTVSSSMKGGTSLLVLMKIKWAMLPLVWDTHTHTRSHTHAHTHTRTRTVHTHAECWFVYNSMYWLNFLPIHIRDTTPHIHTHLSIDILKLIQQVNKPLTISLKHCLSQRELSKTDNMYNISITPQSHKICISDTLVLLHSFVADTTHLTNYYITS